MTVAYSVDEVARMSDDDAVRARFDASTLAWLRVIAMVFFVGSIPHFVRATTLFRSALGGGAVLLAVVTFIAVRKKASSRAAVFVKKRPRGIAMTFLVAEEALLIAFNVSARNRSAMAFAMIIALAAIAFRLLPAEHVLLHASLAGVAAVIAIMMPIPKLSPVEMIVAPIMMNALALTFSMFISRRQRRSISSDWSERRASAREQVRMRDELLYARELQLSMLPECAPALDWVDICSISIPATEVGGDYYDYFVEDGSIALVSGDVAGHGMASGLVLSALRGGFALLRDSLHNPAGVLRRLHDVVTQTTRRRTLVTVSVVRLDRAKRRATIASAGHPPVILRRADGSVSTINLYAPPLGVRLKVDIPQRELDFASGDVFVLHSDGIYETRNAADESYGFDRLESVVREHGGGSAESLRDAILRDVGTFRGALEQDDDVTIVVCRIL